MAEDKIKFVPIDIENCESLLKEVVDDFQKNDLEELSLYLLGNQTPFEFVRESLKLCNAKYFVYVGDDIIAIAAYKLVVESDKHISFLNVMSTNKTKKHPKQYLVAAKMFIAEVASFSHVVAVEVLESYKEAMKVTDKLGFEEFVKYFRKGKMILVKLFKGAKYGMDR